MDNILGFFPERIAMPAGATMRIDPYPGQSGVWIQLVSGGTIALSAGTTAGGQTLFQGASTPAGVLSNRFQIGSTTISPLYLGIRGAFRVESFGTTAVFDIGRELSDKLNLP